VNALLSVRGLTVEYAGRAVLDGVDLHVDAGEAVVVLGGSGSGKSTLLRALLGLVPTPGRVRVDELALRAEDLTAPGALRRARGREIGMVFQDPALALTPLRRVRSLLTEVSGDPTQVEPLLRASGFAEPAPVATRRAFELSGGMAQRVGFGLAVAGGPRVVLADEPTTALDGPAREELVTRLRELAAAGTAVVLVTHDVTVAAALADRIVVLHRGRIVEQGTPARVLGDPVHEATRALVRDVPWALPARPVAQRLTGAPAIRVRGLTKAYAGTPVLDGLDLDVGEGEVVGIAGRSGGGKTTLLRCLLGLEHPDAGGLRLAGIDPAARGWHAVRRVVQLVPQDPRASLNPWRTAAQLVADPLDFHGVGTRTSRRSRARELLAAVGLDGAADHRPNALSTGQCQRVAIARALAVRPRVLVADEPASALDVTLQAELIRVLSQVVAEHGMTALVVSHDLHVLERLCDRIAVLDGGRLVEDLPVERLRSDAAHPRTRSLLSAYPTDPLTGVAG
jgi:peptide/nickel transport system ATP-binding protein